jgi:hypothetical protein
MIKKLILFCLRLALQYEMDPEIRGACRLCVLFDMQNKDIFDKLQGCVGMEMPHTL